jgi:hypothetical protein
MPTFSERLEYTFASLARPLTPEDGQPETDLSDAEARLGLRLPSVLRCYYRLAGRYDRFNCAHNPGLALTLVRPGNLGRVSFL